ncbi:S1C family serine protease [Streptomyces sp. WM6368]|uniref:S1C family serine protease n=1 Tax=Streptomyces sp. WM6368 TaxID=1415554 RepID=UPI0006AD8655|nr:trypsin-like peptidase domain-containing protein [Streptomyces sp. WM6368]KOU24313.1 protease [Streptomyces sp. WM6368]
MADRQQTDPAPQWWSRPEGTPDEGRRGGVPAPRPEAGDEAGAGDGVPLQDASPAPETAPQTAPAADAGDGARPVRYDPWAVEPLQVVDRGREPRGIRLWQVVALGVGTALFAGGIGGYLGVLAERQSSIRLELPQAAAAADKGRAPESVAGIAATALPGVVTLHVRGEKGSGTGTGFVLDQQGHILTNNHVVADSKEIAVTFSTGESVTAELVGRDSGYDLAVVKVSGVRGLQPLSLGNSENVKVGDPVVAIGAPFDLSNTVTAGIISATGRPVTAGGDKGDGSDISYVDALQTDAPINPGNSGGPLLDSKARVVGINSAIRGADKDDPSRQGGSIGLGFAIPINQGKRVAEELIRTGRATHPVIGVTLDMDYTGDGARVGDKGEDGKPSVVAGGPGARAGIRAGDVITKVDGQRVRGGDELIIKIRAHRPGDPLTLTVLRDGRESTLKVVLGSANGS